MFHNLRSTTEKIVTVLMLLVALIACEKVPESNSESDNINIILLESQSKAISLR